MPDFVPYTFDSIACRAEVEDLRKLLEENEEITESIFHEFFVSREHLRALVGLYTSSFQSADRIAWEYPIFGDFRCDFACGDSTNGSYTFVEYEDASPNSIFVKQGARATKAWANRFDAGYSQIIDWFYKLQVMTDTPDMEARFFRRAIRYSGVLVIGRDRYLSPGERLRFQWRQDHVVVNSKHVTCVTYDQFLADLDTRLKRFE